MASSLSGSAPWGLRWRSSTLFITSTVGIGLFTDLFLYGLVVPILPFILRDRVGLPDSQIQSHVSALLAAYAGASVLFSIPAGIIADRTSARQTPFLVGLVALLAATLTLFLGKSVPVLVVARILQGTSAAVVWTIGLALVRIFGALIASFTVRRATNMSWEPFALRTCFTAHRLPREKILSPKPPTGTRYSRTRKPGKDHWKCTIVMSRLELYGHMG